MSPARVDRIATNLHTTKQLLEIRIGLPGNRIKRLCLFDENRCEHSDSLIRGILGCCQFSKVLHGKTDGNERRGTLPTVICLIGLFRSFW